MKNGPKSTRDPLFFVVGFQSLFFTSCFHRMHHKKTQTDNCGGSVITLLTVGHYLPILIFAGVRRQTLASPQLALSLSPHPPIAISPLCLSLSPSISIWWLDGCSPQWFVSTGGFRTFYVLICYVLPDASFTAHFPDRKQTQQIAQMMSAGEEAYKIRHDM